MDLLDRFPPNSNAFRIGRDPVQITDEAFAALMARTRLESYKHQVTGVKHIARYIQPEVGRTYGGCVGIFDEMGAGKTKQTIDAAQVLYEHGQIDRVIVVAPASVRSVWFDPEVGQLAQHLWDGLPATVTEFHSKAAKELEAGRVPSRQWSTKAVTKTTNDLRWIVTNYDFIRGVLRMNQLIQFCTGKTMLVLDESSYIKTPKAQQTMACLKIRERCGWVVLLNGTPIANHPGDLYSQANMMHPGILGMRSYTQFKSRYAIMGGFKLGGIPKQIVGWRYIEELQAKLAPYVLRRLKIDCLDLPPKLPPVVLSVPLSEANWKTYKEMRDEMVTWLTSETASMSEQTVTKVMRLAQITSGFLGGIENMLLEESVDPTLPIFDSTTPTQEVGREKLDALFSWLDEQLYADPNFKVIVWSRFIPEIRRMVTEARERYPDVEVGVIAGGYSKDEREKALRLLNPASAPAGPAFLFGNPASGGLGLTMTAAHHMVRISQDYSNMKRQQSDDRIHRPGQTEPVSYLDIVATGPNGERTIDHVTLQALLNKENLATMTTSAWVKALTADL